MSEPTKTIGFRIPSSIDERIAELANGCGQSKGEWVRDQILQILSEDAIPPALPKPTTEDETGQPNKSLDLLQSRMAETERNLREQIGDLKNTVEDSAKTHKKDLCQLGILTLDAQDYLENHFASLGAELLDAIERLKQSQRSHRNSVLGAIKESQQGWRHKP